MKKLIFKILENKLYTIIGVVISIYLIYRGGKAVGEFIYWVTH